jgi:hypothetical protein
MTLVPERDRFLINERGIVYCTCPELPVTRGEVHHHHPDKWHHILDSAASQDKDDGRPPVQTGAIPGGYLRWVALRRKQCNREQQCPAVRQRAKPLMSQVPFLLVPLSWRDRPPEPSCAFKRKRQIASSGRVWKSWETRQWLQRQSNSTVYSKGVFSRWASSG